MKIAVISDIHGNMQALEAVLYDINKENCEKIFCLGDLAMAGPQPCQTVDKIIELNKKENFYLIAGNTDKMLASDEHEKIYQNLKNKNEIMANAYLDDLKLLKRHQIEFLKSLPITMPLEFGGKKVLLCHGSPRRIDENIHPDLAIEEVEETTKDCDADIIFCGHTHLPCGFQTNTGKTIANAGSVGRPFSLNPKSCYIVLEINENNSSNNFTIQHKMISYDVKKASELLEKRKFSGANKLAKMLISATSRYPI